MKYIDFGLTNEQANHLSHIKWFLSDGNRRSGRSYVAAIAYIQLAMDNPDMSIRVFDHSNFHINNKNILNKIKQIIENNESLSIKYFQFNISENSFKFIFKN